MEMTHWFCAAITTMSGSLAYATDYASRTGFDQASWLPVKGWAFTGGDDTIVVRGDRFMIAERAKVGSSARCARRSGAGRSCA